jgi:hypothetical protein
MMLAEMCSSSSWCGLAGAKPSSAAGELLAGGRQGREGPPTFRQRTTPRNDPGHMREVCGSGIFLEEMPWVESYPTTRQRGSDQDAEPVARRDTLAMEFFKLLPPELLAAIRPDFFNIHDAAAGTYIEARNRRVLDDNRRQILDAEQRQREFEKQQAAEIEAAKERDRQAYRERGWPSG